MNLAETVQWALCLPVALLLSYFSLEVILGLRPLREDAAAARDLRFVVLIPAHDESTTIADTVANVRNGAPAAAVLVVADNCSDDTATIARGAGADVVERFDAKQRGKGYALAFGRDHLSADPPDAVLVLDADCRIQPGGAAILSSRACASGSPVQAANLVVGGEGAGPQVAISNFAMMVKNLFRARGMFRIGGSALLFGTGMAFPWPVFARLPLATGDATEDIRIGLHLVRGGGKVILADDVRVTSPPPSLAASQGQRKRWEHGFLRTMASQALPMAFSGLLRGSRRLTAIGLHMTVPPLALLVFFSSAILVLSACLAAFTGNWFPLLVLAAALILATLSIVAAWSAGGKEVLSRRQLLHIPRYVIWKLPIYLAFFRRRQTNWNRTSREDP